MYLLISSYIGTTTGKGLSPLVLLHHSLSVAITLFYFTTISVSFLYIPLFFSNVESNRGIWSEKLYFTHVGRNTRKSLQVTIYGSWLIIHRRFCTRTCMDRNKFIPTENQLHPVHLVCAESRLKTDPGPLGACRLGW